MATKTANGKYNYSDVYYNKSMDEWVALCHKDNCAKNGWKYTPLLPGAFGYDNIVVSLVYLFNQLKQIDVDNIETHYEILCDAVHRGWCENYQYWRDNSPWNNGPYRKPAKLLGDAQRNASLTTEYKHLPKEEQYKDKVFVDCILYETLYATH